MHPGHYPIAGLQARQLYFILNETQTKYSKKISLNIFLFISNILSMDY